MTEFFQAFRDLRNSPRALWLIIFAYAVDFGAYMGVLTLMTTFLHDDLGRSDTFAGLTVSFFTGLVTLFMLVAGSAEKIGVRRGLLVALAAITVGRAMYGASPFAGAWGIGVLLVGLLFVAMGEGIILPVAYAGVKQYTDEKTNAMGYAFLYAVMNLTIVVVGLVSPLVRVPVERAAKAGMSPVSGINAVNLVCLGITVLCMLTFAVTMTKRVEAAFIRPVDAAPAHAEKRSLGRRLLDYFVGTSEAPSPFRDARFVFFIFMLLPVRTLFAHQWLTLPGYVLRAYPPEVADKMEWIVEWVNPMIVFLGVPTITALTRKHNVYTMMIIGTFVSAAPTFLLCAGPSLTMLITYLVIFSVGEALWSSRFYEYASELAPPGRVAQYMGLANVPWLLAKATTGLYSGAMLGHFVPKQGPQDTGTLWFIYGVIAMSSPIGLILARRWVMKGLKFRSRAPEAAAA